MRAFAIAAVLVFALSLAVLAGFLMNAGPLWHIDAAPRLAPLPAALVDLALIAGFGVQHSGMARRGVKRALRLPAGWERAAYVLASSLALILVCALWQPLAGRVWDAGPVAGAALGLLGAAGLVLAGLAAMAIDAPALLGLRQAGVVAGPGQTGFVVPALYRRVRHPIYLGTLVALWAVPQMSLGHALFSAALSLYTLIGLRLEDRDLRRSFGAAYARYAARVPALIPRLRPREDD